MGRHNFLTRSDLNSERRPKDILNRKKCVETSAQCNKERKYFDSSLDISNASTLPAVSIESDNNVDIVTKNLWRGTPESTCSVADYDGGLISTKVNQKSAYPCSESSISFNMSVNFASRRHIGLLVSTLFAGVLNTCLKHSLLPLFQAEMELEKRRVDAAHALMVLPWSYTFVWGFLSDAVPLLGTRRKAYIIAGWVISMLTCFAMAILNYTLEYNAYSSHLATEEALQKRVALVDGYMGLLMLASFGCVLTLIISKAYIVAQSRRECLTTRGKALGTILLTLFMGEQMGQIISDRLVFNITELGPTIPIVTFREATLAIMFSSLVPIVALVFFYHEDPDPPEINNEKNVPNGKLDHCNTIIVKDPGTITCVESLHLNWCRLRQAVAKESTVHVLQFIMLYVFLSEFSLPHPHAQLKKWCHFTDKAQSSSDMTSKALSVLVIAGWKYCALNWNWRSGLFMSFVLVMLIPQAIYYFSATLSLSLRDPETLSVINALQGFQTGALLILELAICIEIAPVGGEGAFVGILVSLSTMMRLFSTTFSNVLGFFCPEPTLLADKDQGIEEIAFDLGLCYLIKLVSVVALIFLPRQKYELQLLHCYGPQGDQTRTWWVLGTLACAFLLSAVFNALAIFPSTACLRIVGGRGCT